MSEQDGEGDVACVRMAWARRGRRQWHVDPLGIPAALLVFPCPIFVFVCHVHV